MGCIDRSQYLPPMVCEPETVTNNGESGYLTFNESVILKNNHHSDPIALDIINHQNKQPLKINMDFVRAVKERPKHKLDTIPKQRQWSEFVEQSSEFYDLLAYQAEQVWVTWKYDKRGRLYSQGYHVNPQGTSYKKAMLEFANPEIIEVPEEYRA
jgi:hypothetical protein